VSAADSPQANERTLSLDRDELLAWGEEFGSMARPSDIVALSGDLGAGKTTLVQAICRGYGVQEPVTSPTFSLINVYVSQSGSVHHIDLFRLAGVRECLDIGLPEILESGELVIVEWPERAGDLVLTHPGVRRLRLEHVDGDESRRVLYANI
jgi:tRNA threonylcarbamoyladenosine biosynthesis protein TsaE